MTNDTSTRVVVDALTEAGLLDRSRHDDALVVVERALGGSPQESTPLRRRMAEIAGYVGGAFVVGAAALFFGQTWSELGLTEQVGLLLGIAVVLVGVGVGLVVAAGGRHAVRRADESVRRRLTSVLFAGAAPSTGFAVGLLAADTSSAGPALVVFLSAAVAMVICLGGYLVAPTAAGQVAAMAAACVMVPSGLIALPVESDSMVVLGLAVLVLGVLWLVLAEAGALRETLPARMLGCVVAVVGAQLPVLGGGDSWVGYLATALVGGAAFWIYAVRRAWPYLATGVVALTLAVPEAVQDWSAGSLGAAGLLLATGVTLLGAALFGLRLRHEVTE